MINGRYSILTLLIFIVLSCSESEDLPKSQLKLSMVGVEELENQVLLFSASVSNLRGESILEYGFIYGDSPELDFKEDFVVQAFGVPKETFSMSPLHFMALNKEYFVAAFIKVGGEIIQTLPIPFVGKGLASFALDHIESPSPLYFGDTIKLYGTNVFPLFDEYYVNINGKQTKAVDATKDYFSIILPKIEYLVQDDEGVILEFEIIANKHKLNFEKKFPFKKAEFEILDIQKVDFGEEIILKGKYFSIGLNDISIPNYWGLNDEYNYNDSIIYFRINNYIYSDVPEINLKIRGLNYSLNDIVKINPSFFKENQTFNIYRNETVIIEGENLAGYNLLSLYHNVNGLNPEEKYIGGFNNKIEFNFSREFSISQRSTKVYLKNLGKIEDNYIIFNFKDPNLEIFRIPSEIEVDNLKTSKSVTFGGIGFTFSKDIVLKVDVEKKDAKIVSNLPSEFKTFQTTFALVGNDKYIYVGYLSQDGATTKFLKYNPNTNQYSVLEDVPIHSIRPTFFYTYGDDIYLEGGIGRNGVQAGDIIRDVYKFNLFSKSWKKLEREIDVFEFTGNWHSFYFDNKLLIAGGYTEPNDDGFSGYKVMEFIPETESWKEFLSSELLFGDTYESSQVFNSVHIIHHNGVIYGFDLLSSKSFKVSNSPQGGLDAVFFTTGFVLNNKYYSYSNEGYIIEIDPSFYNLEEYSY